MRWCLLVLVGTVLLVGCQHQDEVPSIPPPPEDLSTWTVPELVQPPATVLRGAPAAEKATAAEKVYPFTPGTPYSITVPVGWPLDIVLEPGEQIHNIVGGDRAPPETRAASQTAGEQSPPTAEAPP